MVFVQKDVLGKNGPVGPAAIYGRGLVAILAERDSVFVFAEILFMSLGSHCLSLLGGERAKLNVSSYLEHCARYRWARIEGFREIIEACVLDGGFRNEDHALLVIRGACADAVQELPQNWAKDFPQGEWGRCHADQATSAKNREAMRFDKACIVLKALEIACRREHVPALHSFKPLAFVKIHPAIFKLNDASGWHQLITTFATRMTAGEEQLMRDITRSLTTSPARDPGSMSDEIARSFLLQAFEGRAMTWKNATLLADALNKARFGEATRKPPGYDCIRNEVKVEQIGDRADGGKYTAEKHCNQGEGPFVSLDNEAKAALKKAVELSARRA